MNEDLLIGLAATAVPLLVLGYLFLRRNPAICRFFVALLLVGLGYLAVTDALSDIGRIVQGKDAAVVRPTAGETAPPAAQAPAEPPAVEQPAAAPLAPTDAPVGEPAPAPVEAQPQDAEPEPENMPPPADTEPSGGATQPETLPPANP